LAISSIGKAYSWIKDLVSNSHPGGVHLNWRSIKAVSVRRVVKVETFRDVLYCFGDSRPSKFTCAKTLNGNVVSEYRKMFLGY
jgi:hypothetical protein